MLIQLLVIGGVVFFGLAVGEGLFRLWSLHLGPAAARFEEAHGLVHESLANGVRRIEGDLVNEEDNGHMAWILLLTLAVLAGLALAIKAEWAALVVVLGPLFDPSWQLSDRTLGDQVAWASVSLAILVGLLHAARSGFLPGGYSIGLPQLRHGFRESSQAPGDTGRSVTGYIPGHRWVARWLGFATAGLVLMVLAFAAVRGLALLQIDNTFLESVLTVSYLVCFTFVLLAVSLAAGHLVTGGVLALLLIAVWLMGLPMALLLLLGAVAAHVGGATREWFVGDDRPLADQEHHIGEDREQSEVQPAALDPHRNGSVQTIPLPPGLETHMVHAGNGLSLPEPIQEQAKEDLAAAPEPDHHCTACGGLLAPGSTSGARGS